MKNLILGILLISGLVLSFFWGRAEEKKRVIRNDEAVAEYYTARGAANMYFYITLKDSVFVQRWAATNMTAASNAIENAIKYFDEKHDRPTHRIPDHLE